MGVVFTAVRTVKDSGVSIAGAAMCLPIPEGLKRGCHVVEGTVEPKVNADIPATTLNNCSPETADKKIFTSEVPCEVDNAPC